MTWKGDIEKMSEDLKHQTATKEIKSDQDYIEYVSPYKIKNATGYPIEIAADETQIMEEKKSEDLPKLQKVGSKYVKTTFPCEDGATISYMLDFDLDRLFGQGHSDYYLNSIKVKMFMKHKSLSISPISNINIETNQTSTKVLTATTKEGKQIPGNYYLVCRAEFPNNKRVFTISSPIQIKNNLSTALNLVFETEDDKVHKSLGAGEVAAVPFDFISKGYMTILNPDDPKIMGTKVSILGCTSTDKKYHQISAGDKYYVIKPTKDNEITYLEFNAPFVIKNCLPVPLAYEIYSPGTKAVGMKLKSQETNHIFSLSRANKVLMKLRVQGVETSGEINIYSETGVPAFDKILLKGADGAQMVIDVETILENQGSFKVFFYCKSMIINETLLDLVYYTCEDKKETERRLIAGQYPLKIDDDFNSKVVLYGDTKRVAIATKKSPKAISNSFAANVLGNQSVILEDPSQSKAIEFGVNISIHVAGKLFIH